jgi:Kinesin motor domain
MTGSTSTVKVGVRIRPLLPKEQHQSITFDNYDQTSVDFRGQTFTYDYVFGMELAQQDLYAQTAGPMLRSFLQGYNVTIMAYGQTGSGKTFTMGTSGETIVSEFEGLIPRFVSDMFENLMASCCDDKKLKSSKVSVSFMEIYGEDVYDLCPLSRQGSNGDRVSLPIREDDTGRIFVQGLQEVEAASAAEALDVLSQGSKNRITGSTAMNAGSSRSHAVYSINLQQTLQSGESEDDLQQVVSKLTFVDLAGSERIKRTGAEGQRLKEGIQINSGLFHLGQVINSLADEQRIKNGTKQAFVNYRNSKLTHLLKGT